MWVTCDDNAHVSHGIHKREIQMISDLLRLQKKNGTAVVEWCTDK